MAGPTPIVKIDLKALDEISKKRPKGYLGDVISHGKIKDGFLIIDPENYMALCAKYSPFKLGDWVERKIRPLIQFIDRNFGTKLASCEACSRRKAWLNRLTSNP